MTLAPEDYRKLAIPAVVCLLLVAAGGGLIWWSGNALVRARLDLSGAQTENSQNRERLARIADEEREVREKLAVYRQLQSLGILGQERRLEWADSMKRIQHARELSDLRYRVLRRTLISSVPGAPASVDFHASQMKVDLALLHEGDLFAFLDDLRASGNAYYAVRRCALERSGIPAAAPNLQPRVRVNCDIDLITIVDGAAKPAGKTP